MSEMSIFVRRDSAVKLVDDLAGESPVSADCPVGAVVISSDGTGAHEQARERKRAETTPLRNEAPLNCVALRSQLEHEVTWRAVKDPDERPLRDALDSSPRHHRRVMQMESN